METFKTLLRNNVRQYAMLIALILVMIIFQIATGGVLLLPMNITNVVLQNAYVFILAIGMMLLLINGGNIDLSVGAVVAFVGAMDGILILNYHMNMVLAIVISLVVGFLIGCWQGFWIAYVRIPGFIVTLAGMLVFQGLTLTLTSGKTLGPFSDDFVNLSQGFLPDPFAGVSPHLNIFPMFVALIISLIYLAISIQKRNKRVKHELENLPFPIFLAQMILIIGVIMFASYWLALYQGLPYIMLFILALILIYSFFITKTVSGRYIYAMGGNEKAAKLSGINTNKVLFYCYVNMGVLAAVAGVAYTSRLNAASPLSGQGFEMDAISACFIGGASMYGGAGTVVGAIIGALFMGVLNNGMSILGAGSDVVKIVKGLVLLFAVAFDLFSKSRAKTA